MEQVCKLWLTIYAFQTWSPQHQAHCDAGLLIIPKKKDLGNNLFKRKKTSKTAFLRCRLWWGSRNCQAERRMRGRVQNCCWRTLNQMVSLHSDNSCKKDPVHSTILDKNNHVMLHINLRNRGLRRLLLGDRIHFGETKIRKCASCSMPWTKIDI